MRLHAPEQFAVTDLYTWVGKHFKRRVLCQPAQCDKLEQTDLKASTSCFPLDSNNTVQLLHTAGSSVAKHVGGVIYPAFGRNQAALVSTKEHCTSKSVGDVQYKTTTRIVLKIMVLFGTVAT